MGRPLKQTVDFFMHECKHGKTIFILEQRFGNDGYAFWYKLLELLGDSQNHYYDCNDVSSWQYLLAFTKVDEQRATEIINVLLSLEKIDKTLWQNKIIWCQNFVNRLTEVYSTRGTPLPTPPNIGSFNIKDVSSTNYHIDDTNKCVDSTESATTVVEKSIVENSIYILSVFDFWNKQGVVVHKNLNGSKSAISSALKTYSADEIKQSISNYAEILHDHDKYYWSYVWTLKDFIHRGLDKFLNGDIARQNYSRKNMNKKNIGDIISEESKINKFEW